MLARLPLQFRQQLLEVVALPQRSRPLSCFMWAAKEAAAAKTLEPEPARSVREAVLGPAQFLLVLTCRDEKQQVELLARFRVEGIECKALVS